MQPPHSPHPGWKWKVQLLQQSKCGKPEVPAAHLGSMTLIPSLLGTQTRRHGSWISTIQLRAQVPPARDKSSGLGHKWA